ncbi:glycerophosphodiester phosphodiesterase family protein [Methyloceanibacter sp.]|jgi:glycerophosphoryl diester phosphodiesterase|uniref:glycerophosphodiester phosphodiesterase family protein n=1 Tax=Methyloceanibacter sp. TaxID=1965321 RepID=UPI002B89E584|nr:glycerophosphodiester phosphodiesterase family protein [Methyloceanibacter sp.]
MGELYWLRRPFAHRGLHDATRGVVENSLSAVKAAMGKGYGIEVDLQCAAGGMPVIFHDDTLGRLTEETGPVAARSMETLCRIPLRGSTDFILSLPDLLTLVDGHVPLLLEVKSTWRRDGAFEANITKLLAPYEGPVGVMSFDPYSVAAFRDAAPSLARGLVSERFDARVWPELTAGQRFGMRHLFTAAFARPNFIAYDVQALPAPAPLAARLFGLPLLAWTVRTREERERALRYADAMIFEGIRP